MQTSTQWFDLPNALDVLSKKNLPRDLFQPLALIYVMAVTELFIRQKMITFNYQKKRIFILMRITTLRHCMNCHIGLVQNHA